ncbi:MAG: extracellular solute-binding protein [Lachnospiraceae bacterium]|nr:extracellular solute-binding protein [Lachnospiraceae bacterium]
MKGKIISALAMCAIGFLLIATATSHKDDSDTYKNAEETATSNDKGNTIKIWYAYKGYEDYINSAIEEYKAEKKLDIRIELEYISEPGYFDYINSKSIEGNGPDIFLMGSEYLEKAYLLGLLEENTNLEKFSEDIYGSAAISAAQYNDKLYTYPLGFDVSMIVINNSYVSDEINSFEDIKAYADNFNNISEDEHVGEATDGDSVFSNVKGILSWDVNTLLFNYGFVGNNISFYEEGNKKININNTEVKKSVDSYLLLKDYFSLTGEENYNDIKNSFSEGEIIFTIAGTDIIKTLSDKEIDYTIKGMVNLTNDIECKSLAYIDLLAVNPRSNNISIAKELAEFISYEYAVNMYDISGIISCRKDITYENDKLNDCVNIYDNAIIMPNLLETEDYCIIMEEALKAIWNGSDVNEILGDLQNKYSERIK